MLLLLLQPPPSHFTTHCGPMSQKVCPLLAQPGHGQTTWPLCQISEVIVAPPVKSFAPPSGPSQFFETAWPCLVPASVRNLLSSASVRPIDCLAARPVSTLSASSQPINRLLSAKKANKDFVMQRGDARHGVGSSRSPRRWLRASIRRGRLNRSGLSVIVVFFFSS